MHELHQAAQIGVFRQTENIFDGRVHAHGLSGPGWGEHILGAIGEAVVAKALGIYWNGNMGNLRAGDVNAPIRLEVRTSAKPGNRLICYEKDADLAAFILVTGSGNEYEIKGWQWGRVCKDPKYWTDPGTGRPNYFVPQAELRPFGELKDKLMEIRATNAA